MDISAIRRAYRVWAPVYDPVWGSISNVSRRHAMDVIDRRHGHCLELGVGTGLSLPLYRKGMRVIGIDVSPDMLEKANQRIQAESIENAAGLSVMDARKMGFADGRFDVVVAMFVMRSVPEPERVVSEMERVCRPGGSIFLVNYIGRSGNLIRETEQHLAPLTRRLGWDPAFDYKKIFDRPLLRQVRSIPLRPGGLFTLLEFRREAKTLRPCDRETLQSVSAGG